MSYGFIARNNDSYIQIDSTKSTGASTVARMAKPTGPDGGQRVGRM